MLAQISINAEMALQNAINWAAEYAGVEPPQVRASFVTSMQRHLSLRRLHKITSMVNAGILDKETALKLLQRGEILDDGMDIDEIMSNTETEELDDLEEKEVSRMEELSKIGKSSQKDEGEESQAERAQAQIGRDW